MARRVAARGARADGVEPRPRPRPARSPPPCRTALSGSPARAAEPCAAATWCCRCWPTEPPRCAVLLDTDVLERADPGRRRVRPCDQRRRGSQCARGRARGGRGAVRRRPGVRQRPSGRGRHAARHGRRRSRRDRRGRAVLAAFARRVVRVGDAGAGQAMKLAVNLVVHDLNAALAEALVLAETRGNRARRRLRRARGQRRRGAVRRLQAGGVPRPRHAGGHEPRPGPQGPPADRRAGRRRRCGRSTVTAAAEVVVEAACEAGHGSEDMAALSRFLQVRRLS